ncbi:MAG: hypothetical protein P9L94_04320 [Candidatus Hinthialibacter antarcticus]|nr:hypothetical protein [Candidatus Hinthialibacter antarcticus]
MLKTMRERIKALLTHPYLPFIVAGAAIVFTLPSLLVGWQADDYYHRGIFLDRLPEQLPLLSMFSFFHGESHIHRWIAEGILPWWTWENIRLSFFRPVSIFTHWIDYQFWPNTAPLHHLHNLAWYGALVAAVAVFYRRVMGATWMAGLAAMVYALDDGRGFAVGWIANRNAIIATLFGVLALIAHDRWRRDGWKPGAWLSPGLLLIALLAAEFGVGAFAFFLSYTLCLDPALWRRRWIAIAPSLITILAWQIGYRMMGYGAFGSSYYVDPGATPLQFLFAFIERAPLLLQSQWFGLPAAPVIFFPEWLLSVYWRISLAVLALIALLLAPLLRVNQPARFWAVAMLLALVPVCAVFPAERLLFFVGLGAFPLIALLVQSVFQDVKWPGVHWALRRPVRMMIYFLIFQHCIMGPLLLPFSSISPKLISQWVDQPALSVPDSPSIENETWIVINPPVSLFTFHMPAVRIEHGLHAPKALQPLASGLSGFTITRDDAQTLTVRPQHGFLATSFERLLRGESQPLLVGEQIETNSFTATVLSLTPDNRPAEVRFRFTAPLGDANFRFLQWKNNQLVVFVPPAMGGRIDLDPVRMF